MDQARVDPGSFRDPDSRVLVGDGGVFRALSQRGLEDFRALESTRLFGELTAEGSLVGTRVVDSNGAVPDVLGEAQAAVLQHDRIPFITYPYEWTFGMLRDAALLHLDILERSLNEGLMVKDSSAYNVQWQGARPVFTDIGSFERLREGEPWIGYRQFCMHFLYPLMLQAWKGAPFHPWLRGSVDGIRPAEMRALMAFRDRFRRGAFSNVFLHARLENRYSQQEGSSVKQELRSAGFKTEILKANVRKMRSLVGRMEWNPPESAWTGYGAVNTYTDADAEAKAGFVRAASARLGPKLVWDVGANNGRYSQVALEHADYVLALDADHSTVEHLYRRLRDAGEKRILPLVVNASDPSPRLGWRLRERGALEDRGRPDLVLALALIHHITIAGNVPLREAVDWLASLGGSLVVEFPTRQDPMVKRLLGAKREGSHPDYELEHFERCLEEAFDVHRREELPSGVRVMYEATPRR
jgi:hypothetical protein